jgi:hypothetical protein
MSVQTTYNTSLTAGFAGESASGFSPQDVASAFNEETSAHPFGILLKKGTADNQTKLYTQGATVAGLAMHTHAFDNRKLTGTNGVDTLERLNVMRRGKMWVLAEGTVVKGAAVYARHTSDGGSNTQLGSLRADADGTAQVSTLTPTAANSTSYSVSCFVNGRQYTFTTVSDSTATATEICDALRTLMAADATFTAQIVATGTTTLIMTSQFAGREFEVGSNGPGVISIAATTANAAKADLMPNLVWASSHTGAGIALVSIALP